MPNLYLIQTNEEYTGYDTYDSAVVCAKSEEQARLIHPDGFSLFTNGRFVDKENGYFSHSSDFDGWVHPNVVQVTLIGVAADYIQPGTVVCASFNAG